MLDSVFDLLGKLPGSNKLSLLAYGLKALPGPPILGDLGPLLFLDSLLFEVSNFGGFAGTGERASEDSSKGRISLEQEGSDRIETTMEEIKKNNFAFALKHRDHQWDAHLSHDQSKDKPLLLLYPDKIPFDDLVSVD